MMVEIAGASKPEAKPPVLCFDISKHPAWDRDEDGDGEIGAIASSEKSCVLSWHVTSCPGLYKG